MVVVKLDGLVKTAVSRKDAKYAEKKSFMSKILASAALFLFLLFSVGFPSAYAEWSISAVSERYAPAVVKIMALDEAGRTVGSGSGFFVNNRGAVATNYHVLDSSSKAVVVTMKGEEGEVVGISHADPKVDLLIAETSFQSTLPVTLGDSDKVIVGESVLVMGHAPGWNGTLSTGVISQVRKAGRLALLQLTAPILPGCSGGPVFNILGDVVGIVTAFLENAHFALPVNYLRSLNAHPSALNALRGASVKLEASLLDSTLVDVQVREHPDAAFAQPARPLTVYFRSGKAIPCDLVWKDGETLFLVARGKHFAIGYDLNLIDMKRSLL